MNYPVSKPLPIPESRIAKGPYYANANRIIIKKFLLNTSPPRQKATAHLKIWEHYRRLAVQRKMLPPLDLGINARSLANERLDMLREFLVSTHPL